MIVKRQILQGDGTWKEVSDEEVDMITKEFGPGKIDIKFHQSHDDFIKNEITVYITETFAKPSTPAPPHS